MTWLTVLALAGGTFAIRASMLVFTRRALPSSVASRLVLVAPAALGALTAATLRHHPDPAVLGACGVGFVVVRRTGDLNHALLVGVPAVLVLRALVG